MIMKRTVILLLTLALFMVGPGASYMADITVPGDTVFQPGQSFEKVWRIKNTGDCVWDASYALALLSGDQLGAVASRPVEGTVIPGDEVEIGVTMTAPQEPGVYTGWWQMQDAAGRFFGEKVYVRIIVSAPGEGVPAEEVGGKIAFAVFNPGSGKYDVYVANADGSERRLLVGEARQPAFNHDGRMLAADSLRDDRGHLIIMYTDGSDLWQATNFVEDGQPCWSPDDSRLVFASERQDDRKMRLYILDRIPLSEGERMDGRKLGYPHRCPAEGLPAKHPCWLPDGRLIFQGCDDWATGSRCGLVIASPDGGPGTMLTQDPGDTMPTVYGEQVVFASPTRDGNWELYRISVNGGEVQRLTNNECNDGLPVFSPDGSTVAFVSDEGGAWAIWAINPDGSNRRKLFDLGGGYGEGKYHWTTERISWAP